MSAQQTALLDLANAYIVARALQVTAALRVADALVDGPCSLEQLAVRCGADAAALGALLRLLTPLGIFAQRPDGTFEQTDRSELLRDHGPGSLRDAIVLRGESSWWRAAMDLQRTVETGRYQGPSAREFYAALEHDAAMRERFDRGMTAVANLENAQIAAQFDFSRFRRIVDLGAGQGGFLALALEAAPSARGVLFETPAVVAGLGARLPAILRERAELVAGDFLAAIPQGGDLYILKRILHSFADPLACELLRRCAAALPPHGRLLTIEVLRQAGNEPHRGRLADVMLLMLGAEGRERSIEEMRHLHAEAGLRLISVRDTDPGLSIIEAMP